MVRKLVIVDTPPPFASAVPWPEPESVPQDLGFDGRLLVGIIRQLNAPDPAWWDKLASIHAPLLLIGGGRSSDISFTRYSFMAPHFTGTHPHLCNAAWTALEFHRGSDGSSVLGKSAGRRFRRGPQASPCLSAVAARPRP